MTEYEKHYVVCNKLIGTLAIWAALKTAKASACKGDIFKCEKQLKLVS